MHWKVRGLSCKPNIYVSWSTSELRVKLAPLNCFKPSIKIFYWPFKGGTSFVDLLCFSVLCLLCLCVHLLMCFVVTCWERDDLSALVCGVLLWICHFPIGIHGQVWYLIVSIFLIFAHLLTFNMIMANCHSNVSQDWFNGWAATLNRIQDGRHILCALPFKIDSMLFSVYFIIEYIEYLYHINSCFASLKWSCF